MFSAICHTHHFVCLRCRRSVKGARFYESHYDLDSETRMRGWQLRPMKCSHCGGEMPCVGKHFTPPRRHDVKQWKKLEWMIAQGWRGASWTTPDASLRETKEVAPPRPDPARKRLAMVKKQREFKKKWRQRQIHQARKAHRAAELKRKNWQKQLDYQNSVLQSLRD